jgi:hypothetical protein
MGSKARSASPAAHHGSFGIHLDCGGQDLAGEKKVPFIGRQRLKV